jgi:hypothetical protein
MRRMTNIWKEKLSKNGILDVDLARVEAEQIFERGFMGLLTNFTSIGSFRKVVARGIPAAAPELHKESLAFLTKILRSALGERYFDNPEQILQENRHVDFAKETTRMVVETGTNAMDAASIVFAHAILDGILHDFCTACAVVAPTDWLPFIGQRKISLLNAANESLLDLIGEALVETLNQLERDSLLKKADRLYALCQPPADYQGVLDYTYDRDRLDQLDKLRHGIVHRVQIKEPIANCEEQVTYLHLTGWHFMSLPNYKYDLRIPRLAIRTIA